MVGANRPRRDRPNRDDRGLDACDTTPASLKGPHICNWHDLRSTELSKSSRHRRHRPERLPPLGLSRRPIGSCRRRSVLTSGESYHSRERPGQHPAPGFLRISPGRGRARSRGIVGVASRGASIDQASERAAPTSIGRPTRAVGRDEVSEGSEAGERGFDPRGRSTGGAGDSRRGGIVPVAMPIQTDWVKSVLFDRGYLARIRGEAIKVYLVDARGVRRGARPERDHQPEPVDGADAAVVPDGDREPVAARGPRPGRLHDPRARQGQDLLRARPPDEPIAAAVERVRIEPSPALARSPRASRPQGG